MKDSIGIILTESVLLVGVSKKFKSNDLGETF